MDRLKCKQRETEKSQRTAFHNKSTLKKLNWAGTPMLKTMMKPEERDTNTPMANAQYAERR